MKKELRDAIRTKRLAKGLDELPDLESKRPKSDEVSFSLSWNRWDNSDYSQHNYDFASILNR